MSETEISLPTVFTLSHQQDPRYNRFFNVGAETITYTTPDKGIPREIGLLVFLTPTDSPDAVTSLQESFGVSGSNYGIFVYEHMPDGTNRAVASYKDVQNPNNIFVHDATQRDVIVTHAHLEPQLGDVAIGVSRKFPGDDESIKAHNYSEISVTDIGKTRAVIRLAKAFQ